MCLLAAILDDQSSGTACLAVDLVLLAGTMAAVVNCCLPAAEWRDEVDTTWRILDIAVSQSRIANAILMYEHAGPEARELGQANQCANWKTSSLSWPSPWQQRPSMQSWQTLHAAEALQQGLASLLVGAARR